MAESFPQYNEPLVQENRRIADPWHALLELLFNRSGGGGVLAADSVTVDGSPFDYSVSLRGSLVVSGGTVSKIEITRAGDAIDTGVTAGVFPVMPEDTVTVTYSAAPTVTFLPSEAS